MWNGLAFVYEGDAIFGSNKMKVPTKNGVLFE